VAEIESWPAMPEPTNQAQLAFDIEAHYAAPLSTLEKVSRAYREAIDAGFDDLEIQSREEDLSLVLAALEKWRNS
jgi:hypothetical protein